MSKYQKKYRKINHPYGPPEKGSKCVICGLSMSSKIHKAGG